LDFLSPVEVGSDYAVVVLKDSNDVESVAVYRLEVQTR
jgi:hypothetical protein